MVPPEVASSRTTCRRDIVVGAENIRTGATMAENVLKYLEDKLTQKDMLINKLLMKNQAYAGRATNLASRIGALDRN